jgi:hypothetical protein
MLYRAVPRYAVPCYAIVALLGRYAAMLCYECAHTMGSCGVLCYAVYDMLSVLYAVQCCVLRWVCALLSTLWHIVLPAVFVGLMSCVLVQGCYAVSSFVSPSV